MAVNSLETLRNELTSPLKGLPITLNDHRINVVRFGSSLAGEAAKVVNYAYSLRYSDDGKVGDIASDNLAQLPGTKILVASQNIAGQDIALGTFRVVFGPPDETEELFDLTKVKGPVAELSRFALHPGLKNPEDKYEILRLLWLLGFEEINAVGGCLPLIVLSPKVLDFVTKAGIKVTLIEAPPKEHPTRYLWPKYWKPGEPFKEQPKVYIAHKEMLEFPQSSKSRVKLPQFA